MSKGRIFRKQVVMIFSSFIRLLCIAFMLFLPALSAAATGELFPPADYLHSKLQQNDIVFSGTTHKKPKIQRFIADLIPSLEKLGVSHNLHYLQLITKTNHLEYHLPISTPVSTRSVHYVSGGPWETEW